MQRILCDAAPLALGDSVFDIWSLFLTLEVIEGSHTEAYETEPASPSGRPQVCQKVYQIQTHRDDQRHKEFMKEAAHSISKLHLPRKLLLRILSIELAPVSWLEPLGHLRTELITYTALLGDLRQMHQAEVQIVTAPPTAVPASCIQHTIMIWCFTLSRTQIVEDATHTGREPVV